MIAVIRALPLLAMPFSFFIASCSGGGEAPVAPAAPENPQLQPAILPAYATLDVMESKNLARRLAIELNNSLSFGVFCEKFNNFICIISRYRNVYVTYC